MPTGVRWGHDEGESLVGCIAVGCTKVDGGSGAVVGDEQIVPTGAVKLIDEFAPDLFSHTPFAATSHIKVGAECNDFFFKCNLG
ncbi:MAG: hypothetical protein ROR55_10050 [Devosia sp.]